jgi:predicted flavoprotein YhiN
VTVTDAGVVATGGGAVSTVATGADTDGVAAAGLDTVALVAGAPAKFVCNTDQVKLKDGTGLPAYPWRRHFTRGYPQEWINQWAQEFVNTEAKPMQ